MERHGWKEEEKGFGVFVCLFVFCFFHFEDPTATTRLQGQQGTVWTQESLAAAANLVAGYLQWFP